MEEDWRDKEESKGYHELKTKECRPFVAEDGEIEAKRGWRVNETSSKQSLEGSNEVEHRVH